MGISREQALACCASDDLIGIGMEADAVRRRLHPEGVVSYVVSRAVCVTAPDFEVKAAEAVDFGATALELRLGRGGAEIETCIAALGAVRRRFPSLWLHGLSATEVVAWALPVGEALARLREAGLNSLAGDDAGVLGEGLTTEERCSPAEWLEVHRAAHRLGLPSVATLRFGAGESIAQRIEHLEALRGLQEETGGFVALKPLAATAPRELDEPTAVEYLTTLAVARMMLDGIPNIEADWAGQGLKVLQMALRFGANDVGSVLQGEGLVPAGGTTEEDLRRVIRGAGFRPVERDAGYRAMFVP